MRYNNINSLSLIYTSLWFKLTSLQHFFSILALHHPSTLRSPPLLTPFLYHNRNLGNSEKENYDSSFKYPKDEKASCQGNLTKLINYSAKVLLLFRNNELNYAQKLYNYRNTDSFIR